VSYWVPAFAGKTRRKRRRRKGGGGLFQPDEPYSQIFSTPS